MGDGSFETLSNMEYDLIWEYFELVFWESVLNFIYTSKKLWKKEIKTSALQRSFKLENHDYNIIFSLTVSGYYWV